MRGQTELRKRVCSIVAVKLQSSVVVFFITTFVFFSLLWGANFLLEKLHSLT